LEETYAGVAVAAADAGAEAGVPFAVLGWEVGHDWEKEVLVFRSTELGCSVYQIKIVYERRRSIKADSTENEQRNQATTDRARPSLLCSNSPPAAQPCKVRGTYISYLSQSTCRIYACTKRMRRLFTASGCCESELKNARHGLFHTSTESKLWTSENGV
jgi:hypothetical protein